MEKYRQFSYTNIKNGIPFYREWTVSSYRTKIAAQKIGRPAQVDGKA